MSSPLLDSNVSPPRTGSVMEKHEGSGLVSDQGTHNKGQRKESKAQGFRSYRSLHNYPYSAPGLLIYYNQSLNPKP